MEIQFVVNNDTEIFGRVFSKNELIVQEISEFMIATTHMKDSTFGNIEGHAIFDCPLGNGIEVGLEKYIICNGVNSSI